MVSSRFALAAALACASACGARSELEATEAAPTGGETGVGAGGEGGAPNPCPEATCSDLTRGTFQLLGPDGAPIGWLFMFDASNACNGAPTHYALRLDNAGGSSCLRNSDLVVTENDGDSLSATADNHGGTFTPECGGEPNGETATLRLVRDGCEPNAYLLSVENSKPGSPFTLDARAIQCRCELGWEPCAGPAPDDLCAP
jgi:hypothetical protein